MNQNALITKNNLVPSENEFDTIKNIARMAYTSGLYASAGSEPKILMILLAARELGVSPMIALNGGIWNIQGKIEISSRLMNSMIRRAGHSITVKECDSTKCILEGKRCDNGDTFTACFTMEDARNAGLTGRDTWKKYAEDMLYSRAMSRLGRRLFPDIIGTAYVEGEIQDAKCEIIQSVKEEIKEEIKEDENVDSLLQSFLIQYPEEDTELVLEYLNKYKNHWKKTMTQALNDYRDHKRFMKDFSKWKSKKVSQG
jgi:hypothetical protein